MSTSTPDLKTPDPSPKATPANGQETQNAKRNVRRKAANQFSRTKTVLDNNAESTAALGSKSVLGG